MGIKSLAKMKDGKFNSHVHRHMFSMISCKESLILAGHLLSKLFGSCMRINKELLNFSPTYSLTYCARSSITSQHPSHRISKLGLLKVMEALFHGQITQHRQ
ncbi:hypothetical protein SLE2022_053290 [Rubroshorea leprosula]